MESAVEVVNCEFAFINEGGMRVNRSMTGGTWAAWHASQKVTPSASGYSARIWCVFGKIMGNRAG